VGDPVGQKKKRKPMTDGFLHLLSACYACYRSLMVIGV
jgi:hypothetical protein